MRKGVSRRRGEKGEGEGGGGGKGEAERKGETV